MENQNINEFIFSNDPKKMNWFREDCSYAQVKCPDEFSWTVHHDRQGDELTTTIAIVNNSPHSYFTNRGTIGISFPMVDLYDASDICLDYRCHTHIFCGENTSYVMCLRMGGDAPHLGMVLTEGSLSGYSVERNIEKMSNDRGCFWLHPSPKEFAPGEIMRLSWKIFPHNGKEDFQRKLEEFSSVIKVDAEQYVLFPGEKSRIHIHPCFPAESVKVNGHNLVVNPDGTCDYLFEADVPGEYLLDVEAGTIRTKCRLYVQERIESLVEKRCRFIAQNQQYRGKIKELEGAYLAYDNEEKHLVYTPENDFNAGRERTGMGVLMARFLRKAGIYGHEAEEESLKKYREYYLRELVDAQTGLVCNETGRDNSYFRLYNYPWAATFFVECWKLWKQEEDLRIACKIVHQFYALGGYRFYPIQFPVTALYREVEAAGEKTELEELKKMFKKHGDNLLTIGKHYPAHEVNYEQSIVAPAADVLLQIYEITGEKKYLDGAEEQLGILELFNGNQPDYHLNEVAIRHWDGYWFGKRRLYGDTFPHYWSAETGRIFRRYARLTSHSEYEDKAKRSLRGVLSMFFTDGTATCAYLFPYSVNGQKGEFSDPYANDQDWGLYSNIEE